VITLLADGEDVLKIMIGRGNAKRKPQVCNLPYLQYNYYDFGLLTKKNILMPGDEFYDIALPPLSTIVV